MTAFPNGFVPCLDRYDRRSAAKLFEWLWRDAGTVLACATGFANSIRVAHEAAEGCWSVTMLEDAVRLNVGQVEVLTLWEHATRVLFRSPLELAEGHSLTVHGGEAPIYPAVPIPSGFC